MPTKEEKHQSSGGGSSGSSSGATNTSNNSSNSGTEKHKYCLLCNRNDFTLHTFDPTIEKDLRAIFNIDVIKMVFVSIFDFMRCCTHHEWFDNVCNLHFRSTFENVDQMSNDQPLFIVLPSFFSFICCMFLFFSSLLCFSFVTIFRHRYVPLIAHTYYVYYTLTPTQNVFIRRGFHTDQIQGKPKSMPTMFAFDEIAEAIQQRWTHEKERRLLQGFVWQCKYKLDLSIYFNK